MGITERHTSRIGEGVGSLKGQIKFVDIYDVVTTGNERFINPRYRNLISGLCSNLKFSVQFTANVGPVTC